MKLIEFIEQRFSFSRAHIKRLIKQRSISLMAYVNGHKLEVIWDNIALDKPPAGVLKVGKQRVEL